MSQITLTVNITFENALEPGDSDDVVVEFQEYLDKLIDRGFLDRYGTIYNLTVSGEYDADDT